MARNLCLTLFYVPSKDNPADAPSPVLSDIDCSLIDGAWRVVDSTFGLRSVDHMALPSNVRRDPSGRPFPFYSPFPCPQSVGCNVFSQEIRFEENAYVFPPFVLIGPLLRFLVSQSCAFTIVVPDTSPRKYWWPLVQRLASGGFRLGSKGDRAVLLFPTKSGPAAWEARPLQWDLWVFRVAAHKVFQVFANSHKAFVRIFACLPFSFSQLLILQFRYIRY